jgi:hypothetical protein
MRSAPRWITGLIGASWRIEPSPKYSRLMRTAGNTKGIALEASRCSTLSSVRTPTRWAAARAADPRPWKNDRLSPEV